MKVYIIEGYIDTTKINRRVEVLNKEGLNEYCIRYGITLKSYKEENIFIKIKNKIFNKNKGNIKKILNDQDSYTIIKALHILTYARIPLNRRLEYLLQSVKTKKLQELIKKWDTIMTQGREVSDALNEIGMSDYIVHSVHVGSNSGQLIESYEKILEVLKNKLDTRKKIKSLLRSPMISFVLLFAMFQFYILYYYQQVQNILKYMDKEKFPKISVIFLNWSDYAHESIFHTILFILMSLSVFVLFFYSLSWIGKKIIRFIPGLRNILKYEDYIIFFSLLHIALSSGSISLFTSIRQAAEAVKDYKLKLKLISASEKIESGGVSFSTLVKKENIFNNDFESEAAIANFEETTDVLHFKILIEMQQEKLNDVINILSTLIQPLLMLVVVAAIIVFQYAATAPMWTFGSGGL